MTTSLVSVLIALQLFVVAFIALHDWVPLGTLNNLAAVRAEDPPGKLFVVTLLSTLPFAVGLVASVFYSGTGFPEWLMWWLWISYGAAVYGLLRAWWVPYLLLASPARAARYQARFAGTHAFLLVRNGIRPDTLHCTLHIVILSLLILLGVLTLSAHVLNDAAGRWRDTPMIMAPSMFIHVAAGGVGLVSGAAALAVRKGGRFHRAFGKLFLISMATTAALGAYLGVSVHRGALLIGGILACYKLATAWMTVHRKAGTIGPFERMAPFGALGVAALCMSFGIQATNSKMGHFQGIPAAAYYGQAFVAALAFGLDIKIILRGGISGVPRIARHIWRVCLAFFEATSAFFIGQQKVMPVFMHGSPILMVLGVTPLVVMVFWLVRVRFNNWLMRAATQRA